MIAIENQLLLIQLQSPGGSNKDDWYQSSREKCDTWLYQCLGYLFIGHINAKLTDLTHQYISEPQRKYLNYFI